MKWAIFENLRGVVSLSLLVEDGYLPQGRQEDEQRKPYSKEHILLRSEDVCEFCVVPLGHDVADGEGYAVVHPVEQHTGEDAACTVIHPSHEYADEEGMWHLCGVGMHQ